MAGCPESPQQGRIDELRRPRAADPTGTIRHSQRAAHSAGERFRSLYSLWAEGARHLMMGRGRGSRLGRVTPHARLAAALTLIVVVLAAGCTRPHQRSTPVDSGPLATHPVQLGAFLDS